MYSPVKDINNNVRMGINTKNKKKHIIYGKRIIRNLPNSAYDKDSYKDHQNQSKPD